MYEVLVVGGGPAGLTAALYASRQGHKTAVITIDVGGQLLMSPRIENFPATPPLSGFELANGILEQVKEFGAELIYDEVVRIEESDGGFRVKVKSGGEYEAKALILAVGKRPRKLNAPGEDRFSGKGVSYCAVCDAPLYRGKRTTVIGWGEPAYEAATILRRYENEVYVIHSGRVSPSSELAEKLKEIGAKVIDEAKVEEIRGDLVVRKLILRRLKDESVEELEVDGVFIELGYVADTGWLRGFVELNENGEIITDKLGRTSRKGVFAAGDATDMPYKQAVIAAAQGAIAALSASNYLRSLLGKPEVRSDWRKLAE
ncbi:MAG: FAD-dependent oxidoreductase [Thaumarchaeota archaeon]|nr:FAD-dependent oxidoreductase [Nitrososphaerota archaeon]